jgi:hypothetical protein
VSRTRTTGRSKGLAPAPAVAATALLMVGPLTGSSQAGLAKASEAAATIDFWFHHRADLAG